MREIDDLFKDLNDLFFALRSYNKINVRRVLTRMIENGWDIDDQLFRKLAQLEDEKHDGPKGQTDRP